MPLPTDHPLRKDVARVASMWNAGELSDIADFEAMVRIMDEAEEGVTYSLPEIHALGQVKGHVANALKATGYLTASPHAILDMGLYMMDGDRRVMMDKDAFHQIRSDEGATNPVTGQREPGLADHAYLCFTVRSFTVAAEMQSIDPT